MSLVLRGDRCRCSSCGLFFNSTAAFTKHRSGKYPNGRRCLSEAELTAKGYAINAAGFWTTGAMPAFERLS
jgi:hypothetical protein